MKHRKLRIAWLVGGCVTAVLTVLLSVRSYSTLDNIAGHLPFNPGVSCTSAYGRLAFASINANPTWSWKYHNAVLDGTSYGGHPNAPRPWFMFQRRPADTSLMVPHGCLAIVAMAAGLLPWLPFRRFSLRTLLIAMTLVAVVLGLIVFANRN